MDIVEATRDYETWLAGQVVVVEKDLERKHARMEENAFVFLRATHYRWLQTVLELVPGLDAPAVACVGDLHVENFGTWRDAEGRLVWGVNDFDESETLPYTLDLARLATSATLAIDQGGIALAPAKAHAAILEGYRNALARGPRAYVLAGRHRRLAGLVAGAVTEPKAWWAHFAGELKRSGGALPDGAVKALRAIAPARDWDFAVHTRVAGVGSLGHQRLVALGDLGGAPAARELKQLSPPSGRWLGRRKSAAAGSPDPLWAVRSGWQARRLAPDCVKLDLTDLDTKGRERRMFTWMGFETGNVHLRTPGAIDAVRADLEARGDRWLGEAAGRMADATRKDHGDWARRSGRRGGRARRA